MIHVRFLQNNLGSGVQARHLRRNLTVGGDSEDDRWLLDRFAGISFELQRKLHWPVRLDFPEMEEMT